MKEILIITGIVAFVIGLGLVTLFAIIGPWIDGDKKSSVIASMLLIPAYSYFLYSVFWK